MSKLFSFFSLKIALFQSVRKRSRAWGAWLIILIVFRMLRWLFSRPHPQKLAEFDLDPGEYSIIVEENT